MKVIISLYLLLFLVACTSPKTDSVTIEQELGDSTKTFYTKPYYFPVEALKEGKVYEYSMIKDSTAFVDHYWHLQTVQDDKGQTFLIWKRYNPFFEQDQYIKEWVVKDGVVTKAYEMFVRDSTKQTPTRYINKVEENIVFPFQATLDSNMAYRFRCTLSLPPDFITVRLVRDRQFSQPLIYPYKGKKIPAVAFSCTDLYDLEDQQKGGYWEQKTTSVEIYAKGIGLVQTKENQSPSVTRLSNIYTLEEFNQIKRH